MDGRVEPADGTGRVRFPYVGTGACKTHAGEPQYVKRNLTQPEQPVKMYAITPFPGIAA